MATSSWPCSPSFRRHVHRRRWVCHPSATAFRFNNARGGRPRVCWRAITPFYPRRMGHRLHGLVFRGWGNTVCAGRGSLGCPERSYWRSGFFASSPLVRPSLRGDARLGTVIRRPLAARNPKAPTADHIGHRGSLPQPTCREIQAHHNHVDGTKGTSVGMHGISGRVRAWPTPIYRRHGAGDADQTCMARVQRPLRPCAVKHNAAPSLVGDKSRHDGRRVSRS